MYVPEQGDIIQIDFDPSAGKEVIKRRPAYVLSRLPFNDQTEFAIVAPITSTVRGISLEVVLAEATKTHGSILVHQMHSLDFKARSAVFVEKCPSEIREKVMQIAKLLVS